MTDQTVSPPPLLMTDQTVSPSANHKTPVDQTTMAWNHVPNIAIPHNQFELTGDTPWTQGAWNLDAQISNIIGLPKPEEER